MAKPIGQTPILEGKSARRFLKKMEEPPSKEKIEYWKKINSQREVLF